MRIFKGRKPDVTPAQVIGLLVTGVPVLATVLHVFHVYDLSHEQTQALTDALQWCGVSSAALFVSDAHLRASRGKAEATVQAASFSTPLPMTPATLVGETLKPIPGADAQDPVEPPLPTDAEEDAALPPADASKRFRRGMD